MINYDVYGRPEQWIDAYFNCPPPKKNKKAFFDTNKSTLADGVAAAKLSYDRPIDKTLSYCGLGTESALSHIAYIAMKDDEFQIIDFQDREVTNFSFFEKTSNTYYSNYSYFELTELKERQAWQQEINSSYNINPALAPLTLINPKICVLLITVTAYNSDLSLSINCDLYTYKNTYYQTYPNLVHAQVGVYMDRGMGVRNIGGYETPLTNQIPMTIGILDQYNIESKNFNFYSYYLGYPVIFGSPLIGIQNTYFPTTCNLMYVTAKAKDHIKISPIGNNYNLYIEYYPELIEDIMKTAACFGLYFTDRTTTAERGTLTDPDMYIGLIDNNGVGRGDYYRGTDTVRAPQAREDWEDMASHTGYNPNVPYIDYDTSSHYGSITYSSFNRMYAITGTQAADLARLMSTAMASKPADVNSSDYCLDTFCVSSPEQGFISLFKYPIVDTAASLNPIPVKLGGYTSDIIAYEAKHVDTIIYNFTGSKKFISNFGNSFLDREPYTSAELYIPFCGSIKLTVDECIDQDLSVKLVVDYMTGTCTAFFEINGIPRQTISGCIGLSVPLSAVQQQDLASTLLRNDAALKSAQLNYIGSAARAAANVSAGAGNLLSGSGGAISGIAGSISSYAAVNNAALSKDVAAYELHHTQIPFKMISPGSALTAGYGEWRCRLKITRPVLSPDYDPAIYAKTVGFACLKNTTVKNLSGLTVGAIDLTGINCTAAEKDMIITAFKNGVIL